MISNPYRRMASIPITNTMATAVATTGHHQPKNTTPIRSAAQRNHPPSVAHDPGSPGVEKGRLNMKPARLPDTEKDHWATKPSHQELLPRGAPAESSHAVWLGWRHRFDMSVESLSPSSRQVSFESSLEAFDQPHPEPPKPPRNTWESHPGSPSVRNESLVRLVDCSYRVSIDEPYRRQCRDSDSKTMTR